MSVILEIIGAIFLAIIMYIVPILTACAYIYNWDSGLRLLLILASVLEFIALCILIVKQALNED